MKIIIFGSTGLVGSALVRTFKNTQYEIFTPRRQEVNLFSDAETKKYINDMSPDIIINAAAKVGGIVANNRYRTEFIIQNLKINMNILESCTPFPNVKIINLGSSCIYPLNAENPIKEESFLDGKLEPTNSPYALAKITAIELGKEIKYQYGNKVINLMPTNLYGYNDNFDLKSSHVLPAMIRKFHEAKENNNSAVTLWGSGTPMREFLFVDDLAQAVVYALEHKLDDHLYNVGSGEDVTIKELASIIQKITGHQGDIIWDSTKPDGTPRKLMDVSKMKAMGWEFSTELETGIQKTYTWFLENIKNFKEVKL